MTGKSGADLEYERMLREAGIAQASAQGYDAARLEQLRDANGWVVPDLDLPARLRSSGKVVTDWNTATENGFYSSESTALNVPPEVKTWVGTVIKHPSGDITQMLGVRRPVGGLTNQYQRYYDSVSFSWQPWVRHYTSEIELDTRYKNVGEIVAEAELPTRLRADHNADVPGGDWNNAVQTGWYAQQNATNAPNGSTVWFIGTVIAHLSGWVTQNVFEFTTDSSTDTKSWRRERNDNVWGPWYRVRQSEVELDARYALVGRPTPVSTTVASPTNNYWSKLATFTTTNTYTDAIVKLLVTADAVVAPSIAEVTISVRANDPVTGGTADYLYVDNARGLTRSNFRLVKSQVSSGGSNPNIWELWVQAPQFSFLKAYELGRSIAASATVTYHSNAGWQAAPSAGLVIEDSHDSGWIAPTLLNSWINSGGVYGNAGYRKIGNRVHLKGTIKSGTMTSPAFNLPVGYRPINQMNLPTVGNASYAMVILGTGGDVTPFAGSNIDFNLDGISFLVN